LQNAIPYKCIEWEETERIYKFDESIQHFEINKSTKFTHTHIPTTVKESSPGLGIIILYTPDPNYKQAP